MGANSPTFNLPATLGFYGIFFALGWLYPKNRPGWQRSIYIVSGLAIAVVARRVGVDIGLFVSFYIAKSYFLLYRRTTLVLAVITGIAWTISEYFAEVTRVPVAVGDAFAPHSPLKFFLFTLLVYTASNLFVIMFSAMVVAQNQSRQRGT